MGHPPYFRSPLTHERVFAPYGVPSRRLLRDRFSFSPREACEAFIKRGVRFLQLKLILLLGSVPDGDKEPQDLLSKFALIERFTPYTAGGRGSIRGEEARKRLEDR